MSLTSPPGRTLQGLFTPVPLATRLVRDGIFAEICRLFDPCLNLADPELNDPEAYREVPTRVHTDRHTLASLARTCRVFNGIALDALWRRLDSPEPLLRLLLGGVRRVPVDDPNLAEDPFEGNVLIALYVRPPAQRLHFGLYAGRVKSLRILKEFKTHPSVYFQAAMACDSSMKGRLLPVLEELYCEPSETLSQAIMLFASPRLLQITFSLSGSQGRRKKRRTREDYGLISIIDSLAHTAPAVQVLIVNHATIPQALLNVHGLRNIRVLDIRHTECSGHLLQSLSYLRHLARLTLTAFVGGFPIEFDAFNELKHVRFIEGTFAGAARVLLSLGRCELSSLEVDGTAAHSAHCLKQFSLSAQPLCERSADTLDALSIRGTGVLSAADKENEAGLPGLEVSEFLEPFARCANLSSFALTLPPFCALSDRDLQYIGRWPPLLARLDLSSMSVTEPLPSFTGIVRLVEACPRLRVLQLSTVAAPTPDPLEWPVRNNHLEVLVIANQRYPHRPERVCVDDRVIIAEIVDRLFPNLDPHASSEATKALPGGVDRRWRKMVDELAYIRFLRRDRGEPAMFFVRVSDRLLEDEGEPSYPVVYLSATGTLVDEIKDATYKVYKRI